MKYFLYFYRKINTLIRIININTDNYRNYTNYFYCGRKGGNILGNPYSHLPEEKCSAIFKCKDREEAVEKYNEYFDLMYGHNIEFTYAIDTIYNIYKTGQEVTLGCHCVPKECHCSIIKKKLEERLFKEKITELKKKKNENQEHIIQNTS